MKNLCIYHASCADGFGAALAVKLYFDGLNQKCEFLPAHYGNDVPDVTGKNVIIVDFSYPRDVLIRMNEDSESLTVLDHHKTAEKDLKGLDFCIFDMERSGAVMAWEHFHGKGNVPLLFQYIQDRDLWQWELPNSKEFSAGLQLLPMEFSVWEKYLDTANISELIEKGETVLKYQEQVVERATRPEKVKLVEVQGFTVPILNTTTLVSEICGKLAEDYPFAVTYFDTPEDRVYSLRSRNGGEDVSIIAKAFGGGGHPAASGFSIPLYEKQL